MLTTGFKPSDNKVHDSDKYHDLNTSPYHLSPREPIKIIKLYLYNKNYTTLTVSLDFPIPTIRFSYFQSPEVSRPEVDLPQLAKLAAKRGPVS